MHRIAVDLAWATLMVYLGALVLREISTLTADSLPSISRGIEYAIGTGGHGKGTSL